MLTYTSAINFRFIDSSHKLPSHGARPEQSAAAPSAGGCEPFHVWVQSFLERIRLTFRVWCECDARFTPDASRMAVIGTRHAGIVLAYGLFWAGPVSDCGSQTKKNEGIRTVFIIKHHDRYCNSIFFVYIYHQYPNRAWERSTHTCTPMNKR